MLVVNGLAEITKMTQAEHEHDEHCNHEHETKLDNQLRFFMVTRFPTIEGDYNNSLENEIFINVKEKTFVYIYNRQHNTYAVERQDENYTAVIDGKYFLFY
jgi:hypothetical protein